jgi:hypothetical protein
LGGSNQRRFFEVNAGGLDAMGNVGKKKTWVKILKMSGITNVDHVDRSAIQKAIHV